MLYSETCLIGASKGPRKFAPTPICLKLGREVGSHPFIKNIDRRLFSNQGINSIFYIRFKLIFLIALIYPRSRQATTGGYPDNLVAFLAACFSDTDRLSSQSSSSYRWEASVEVYQDFGLSPRISRAGHQLRFPH